MRSTFSAAVVASTSTTSTLAPSSARRRAVAPPIPCAPPVTIATRSCNRCISVVLNLLRHSDAQTLRRSDGGRKGDLQRGQQLRHLAPLRIRDDADRRAHLTVADAQLGQGFLDHRDVTGGAAAGAQVL